jgi:hypothetical protein
MTTTYVPIKISAFPTDTDPTGVESIILAHAGNNYRLTLAELADFVQTYLALGLTDLADWEPYYDPELIPVGSVLYYNPEDGIYPDSFPPISNYSNGAEISHNVGDSRYPVRAVNTGLNPLTVIVNTTYWPIGNQIEVVQASAEKVQFQILTGESTIVLVGYGRDGVEIDSFSEEYGYVFRTTGPDAEATVKRISATRYVIRGDIELVP